MKALQQIDSISGHGGMQAVRGESFTILARFSRFGNRTELNLLRDVA